jgi:hypothetical protein
MFHLTKDLNSHVTNELDQKSLNRSYDRVKFIKISKHIVLNSYSLFKMVNHNKFIGKIILREGPLPSNNKIRAQKNSVIEYYMLCYV